MGPTTAPGVVSERARSRQTTVVSSRVGQGVDVHAFADDPERPLVLGGVRVPGEPGLAGHSDADVVLHAISDALLGAAGLGDMGTLFGSEDEEYAGADSQVFVAGALNEVARAGWTVSNLDATLVAARPRLGAYRTMIREQVSRLLGLAGERVNVKATTTDRLGFTGRGEGMACLVVVLLESS